MLRHPPGTDRDAASTTPSMMPVLLHVVLVVFFATLIRSAFGFGEALVAVPLLAFRGPVGVAAPLAVLLSITVAAVIVAQDWRSVHVHSAKWLVIATCFWRSAGPGLPEDVQRPRRQSGVRGDHRRVRTLRLDLAEPPAPEE